MITLPIDQPCACNVATVFPKSTLTLDLTAQQLKGVAVTVERRRGWF